MASTTKNSAQQITVKSPAELTAIIERLTDSLAGTSGGFSTESIVIKLVSETAPDLTVIDLPGIVRTATKGQSSSVIDEVNGLINHHLRMERTIILAVIPCNQDIATVDILERASAADPEGIRTIGVLTKPDLIGAGSEDEVLAVLHNVRKPLKLGYIMVKNRSQKELADKDLTLEKARAAEMAFFAQHPVFQSVDSSKFGVDHLTACLTKLLVRRIQQELVPMKHEVETALQAVSFPFVDIGRAGHACCGCCSFHRERVDSAPPHEAHLPPAFPPSWLFASYPFTDLPLPVRCVAQVRAELKGLECYGAANTPAERQKLLVTLTQEYMRHLSDCVRGEYRDRLIVTNPDLRLYTRALNIFTEFQARIQVKATL